MNIKVQLAHWIPFRVETYFESIVLLKVHQIEWFSIEKVSGALWRAMRHHIKYTKSPINGLYAVVQPLFDF